MGTSDGGKGGVGGGGVGEISTRSTYGKGGLPHIWDSP